MSQNQNQLTNIFELLLESMRLANVLTPGAAAVISIVRSGREQGKDDEAIKSESAAINNDTIDKADAQLAVKADDGR